MEWAYSTDSDPHGSTRAEAISLTRERDHLSAAMLYHYIQPQRLPGQA